MKATSLADVQQQIVGCTSCVRLRTYCARIAREKKAAHRDDVYWGKPVPGFGDPNARLLVLGLAPAAHGANRTGRVFTGDGSGDFLMRAMHAAGFANITTSRHAGDGLTLTDAYIAAAVRCAPPDNKPAPSEIAACHPHLVAEAAALPNLRTILCLGKIGFDAAWRLLASRGVRVRPRPPFGHGALYRTAGATVIASYHPSRQNTNTGKLTPRMLASVFRLARRTLEPQNPRTLEPFLHSPPRMRNRLTHIGTAVLVAAMAVGCSRPAKNNTNDTRYYTEGGRNNSPAAQFIKLDGCVQPGSSANGEYVLRDVIVPPPATQPLGQETMEHPPVVPGSWVRLVGDEGELKDNLGKRVEVMGRMEDTGANTLGTSGRTTPAKEPQTNKDKFEQSSKDADTNPQRNMNPTTAAPFGADANGMAPRLAIEKVTKLADTCNAGKTDQPKPGK